MGEEKDAVVAVETVLAAATVGSVKVRLRSYFSSHYLYSAQFFSSEAGRIEVAARERGESPLFDPRHRAFVISSITASCAFLEAMVNELLEDIADGFADGVFSDYVSPLPDNTKRVIAVFWRKEKAGRVETVLEKSDVLTKLDMILATAGLPRIDTSRRPWQEVDLVIKIRNALTHYKPQSLGDDDVHYLTKKLQGGDRFQLNPLVSSGNPYFPDKALGHGCADWAWRSCKQLADEFSDALGIMPNYRRAVLSPESLSPDASRLLP
ncbi:hypothetical protein ThrDRAFT_01695 [Frankia casuarinae]|uniref:Uncharacterized protein n=1 Tax=Frankia casuarinae (strain DSM 45818 / CECT 9043 / HFP020203 / CcI3) TaxID=106370 RepID=Q2JEM1_FRACC|nr:MULTISPECIES: hypothetical protein [Frankia]ABD10271.1 hypothetical protein Francci3_0887 [Frankia casuarinae]ETA01976.1 hypothetical protein CcI6DRAFT_02662 [Frankia sp. CcI6]EYT92577.1 hypothetical protein ThrDRAFT_01695 [Frankia casuarinae]KFB05420.1 hypothetical protein ALLO2DRAFT_01659 [Frankia sp. Allo2]OAA24667.1 hypothetical protein AAY23_104583 [Frankia casuarinae]